MRRAAIGCVGVLALAAGSFAPAKAASNPGLVPGYEATRD